MVDYQTQEFLRSLTKHQCNRLLAIITRAAPPHERATEAYFTVTPDQDPQVIKERSLQWVEAATHGDQSAFSEYLAARGLNWSDFLKGLSEVTIKDPGRLPAWGEALVAFLQSQATPPEEPPGINSDTWSAVGTEAETPMQLVYQAYIRASDYQLRPCIAASGLVVSTRAASQLAAQLANRLVNVTARALDFELSIKSMIDTVCGQNTKDVGLTFDVSLDGWLDRLDHLPGLAYVIGVTCAHWLLATTELFDRLRTDWEMLREELWGAEIPSVLIDFKGDAGDPHDGGRSVALLTFTAGKRVVYKPKDLRVAAAFVALIRFLNNEGLSLQLPVRKILPRSGYTWEEYVEHGQCRTSQQVERFYFRMGMTLRLLQFIEGRDFWLDNLIASGEYPVFIDLETILQPRNQIASTLSPAEREVRRTVEDSLVMTGAITAPLVIDIGVRAEDFGALTSWRELVTPFKPSLKALQSAGSTLKMDERGYIMWAAPPYIPIVDDHPANASHYLNNIAAGYQSMHDCLFANRTAFISEDGPLQVLADLPVRYIWRDTWTCHAIIQESLGPLALSDGIAREIGFARLFQAALADHQSQGAITRIIHSEIDAFRDLDVPLFLAVPNRSSILTASGMEIPGFFEGTAYERLLARAAGNELAIEEQLDMFKSCLDSVHRGQRDLPAIFSVPHLRTSSSGCKNWLNRAVAIGDIILSHAKHGPEGDLAWLGLLYYPYYDMHALTLLQPDLLTGTCGLAVLFADLFAASGLGRFEMAARQALDATSRAIASAPSVFDRDLRSPVSYRSTPFPCGAFVGAGSQIYALRRCALALEDLSLGQIAASFAASLPVAQLCANSPIDVVSGIGGLLLAISAPANGGYSPPISLVNDLAEQLLRFSQSSEQLPSPPYPPEATFLDGLPGTADGVGLALARAAQHQLLLDVAVTASEMAEGHGEELTRSHRHRTAGELISALGRPQVSSDHELVAEIDRWLGSDPAQMDSVALLDAIEVAITVYQVTKLTRFLEQAELLAGHMVARRDSTGSWFADRIAQDRHNLSIVWGLAAVAHALMKLEDPVQFRSVRLLT